MTRTRLELDKQAREVAQTEFLRPIVLEAGAGTGKTATLVARILAWSLGAGWQRELPAVLQESDGSLTTREVEESVAQRVLEGVTAITFTEAAAAEMAEKVARGLALIASGEAGSLVGFDVDLVDDPDDGDLAERARTLLGHLERLEVRTIHAFCQKRLSSYPLELGMHPELRIDAELQETEEVIREIVERRVREAYEASGDSPILEASAFGISPEDLVKALLDLVGEAVPHSMFASDPLSPDRTAAARDALLQQVDSLLSLAGDRMLASGRNAAKIANLLARTREELIDIQPNAPSAAITLVDIARSDWQDNLLKHLAKWSKGNFNGTESKNFQELERQVQAASGPLREILKHLAACDPERLTVIREALDPLYEETLGVMRSRGVIVFEQILQSTRTLLQENPGALARERGAMRQLLVDEFQDTNEVQCEIVRLLALADRGSDAERPGLFVVGDPKQSIYGWRSADLEAYHQFVETVHANGGATYQLVQNFRSAPILLDQVERTIEPIMHEEPGLQPVFEGLEPSDTTRSWKGHSDSDRAPFEWWFSCSVNDIESGELDTTEGESSRIEATAVAADMRELEAANDDLEWSDFGLLFRATSSLDVYLDAFRRAGIPFVVTRDKQYFRRREIIDATALLRLIVNPTDQIALLTVLRSALFGVPDAALIPLWKNEFPRLVLEMDTASGNALREIEEVVHQVVAGLPADIPGLDDIAGWEVNLIHGLRSLAELRVAIRSEPPDRFIERLRRTTLLEAGEASRYLGNYRVANLERLFRQIETGLEESGGNLQAVLRSLRRSIAEAKEAEEARPKSAAENAVQVMTIHKAKGLQFRHVYVVRTSSEPRSRSSAIGTQVERSWGQAGPREYALLDTPTLGFHTVQQRSERVAAAETVRLLYVAMTRAESRLVLAGNWRKRAAKAPLRDGASLLDLARQREDAPDSIVELASRSAAARGWTDSSGIRWKFPAIALTKSTGSTDKRAVELPSRRQIEKDARALRGLRAKASERMARPLIGAASHRDSPIDENETLRPPGTGGGVERTVAREVGTAVHSALEGWDLSAPVPSECGRQRELIAIQLRTALPPDDQQEALDRADAILASLARGRLLQRLVEQREQIVARELAVLVPAGDCPSDALAGVSGVVDLVLRNPDTGRLVVVDYKTDAVEANDDLDEYARRYADQLTIYALALEQALDLPYRPRAELWFVSCDRVWTNS